MVLRLISCSPRRRIRLATVVDGLRLIGPGRADFTSASLTPATGARTTRLCRTQLSSFVCAPLDRSRLKPPCDHVTRPTLPRPPQPAPTFVTMANAPLAGRDGASCRFDLGQRRSGIFFLRDMDTQIGDLPVRQNQLAFPAGPSEFPSSLQMHSAIPLANGSTFLGNRCRYMPADADISSHRHLAGCSLSQSKPGVVRP
jgi:hypothetical protein